MPTFTYDQFQKAAQDSGLMGEFSAADLSLAQRNPDAGMSLLKYKQDYHAATTDEARALANLGAEGIRSSYGNYTGGDNGGSFYLAPSPLPASTAGRPPPTRTSTRGTSQTCGSSRRTTEATTTGRPRRSITTATTTPSKI